MVRVEYRGPARAVQWLAQMLTDEGLDVNYEPPQVNRWGGVEAVTFVVFYIGDKVVDATVGESIDALTRRAIVGFRDRHKNAPGVEIEVRDDE